MDNHRSLMEAIAALQSEMPVISKTKKAHVASKGGSSYAYTYADLATVWTVLQPGLTKHGLVFICLPQIDHVVARLQHVSSGESIEGTWPLRAAMPQDRGTEMTYARRYLLASLTGVVTDDDDDAQAANAAAMARRQGNHNTQPQQAPAPEPVNQPSSEWDGALAQAKQLRDQGMRVKGVKAQEVLNQMNQAWVGGGLRRAPKEVRDTFVALANEVKARVDA